MSGPPATLDINVLLSSLLGPHGPSRQVLAAWETGRFPHITSDHIITGFQTKLTDTTLLRRFPFLPDVGGALLPLLRLQATRVPLPPAAILPVTGDPEDDAVLATARLGGAAHLVTGDHGLLALGTYAGVQIVTPRAFIDLLGREHALEDDRENAPGGGEATGNRTPRNLKGEESTGDEEEER